MCLEKEEIKELLERVAKVKHDTGNIRTGLQSVEDHMRKLNSRTSKLESKVFNLEDPLRREGYCVQKDTIQDIRENMLTVERFRQHVSEDRQDRIEERQRLFLEQEVHDRKQLIYVKVFGLVVAGLVLLFNILPLIQ